MKTQLWSVRVKKYDLSDKEGGEGIYEDSFLVAEQTNGNDCKLTGDIIGDLNEDEEILLIDADIYTAGRSRKYFYKGNDR